MSLVLLRGRDKRISSKLCFSFSTQNRPGTWTARTKPYFSRRLMYSGCLLLSSSKELSGEINDYCRSLTPCGWSSSCFHLFMLLSVSLPLNLLVNLAAVFFIQSWRSWGVLSLAVCCLWPFTALVCCWVLYASANTALVVFFIQYVNSRFKVFCHSISFIFAIAQQHA